MHILQTFRVTDVLYTLCDDTANNDDRTVCKAGTCTPLLVFTAELAIRLPDGSKLAASMHSRNNRWRLAFNFQFYDLGPLNDWHWLDLLTAECEAAKIILPTLD